MTLDPASIEAALAAIGERLAECRAAAAVVAEGDPAALTDLSREVDAMAAEIAGLKAALATPALE